MNSIKKPFYIFLSFAIVLSLCACGKKESSVQTADTSGQLPVDSEQIDFSSVVTVVSTPVPAATVAPTIAPTEAPIYTPEPTPVPTSTAVATPIPTASATTSVTTGGSVVITKSPTSETVYAGGEAYFTAYGENYNSIEWLTASPGTTNRTIYTIQDAPAHFSGLQVSGQGTNVLHLTNIPAEMNGWEIQAKFIGTYDTKWSDDAYITVTGASTGTTSTTTNSDTEKLVLNQAKACLDGISTYAKTLGYSVGGFENYSYANGTADFNVTVTGSQYVIVGEFVANSSTYYPIYANVFYTSSTPTPLTFQNCSMNDFYTVLSNPSNYVK